MKKQNRYFFYIIGSLMIGLLIGYNTFEYIYHTYVESKDDYMYFSTVTQNRISIVDTASLYYDRGSYIQYDGSYLDDSNKMKRTNMFFYPEEATIDNTVYMDGGSFIANVYYTALGYDIVNVFNGYEIRDMISYSKTHYQNFLSNGDEKIDVVYTDTSGNSYLIDYLNDTVTKTTGSFGEGIPVILVMYQENNNEYEGEVEETTRKANILEKMRLSLKPGDVLVYEKAGVSYALLYLGSRQFLYCSGQNYDYELGKDNIEDKAIKYMSYNELLADGDNYLFSDDIESFSVVRILNLSGMWDDSSYASFFEAYNYASVDENKLFGLDIYKTSSVSNNQTLEYGQEVSYTISFVNNSNYDLLIPKVSDVIPEGCEYVSNSIGDENYSSGVLSWDNVVIPKSSTFDITYTIRIGLEVTEVLNNATYVYDGENKVILNSISHNVGTVLSEEDNTKLVQGAQDYEIAENFVQKIYKEVLNKDFTLEIDENIWTSLVDIDSGLYKESDDSLARNMLISGVFGGRGVYTTTSSSQELRVREVREEYLMSGDVIVITNDNETSSYLYLNNGEESMILGTSDTVSNFLEKILINDMFMVLRPSLVLQDIEIIEQLEFGNLVVDTENLIIKRVKPGISYDDVIREITTNGEIYVLNKNNALIDDTSLTVKTGEVIRVVFDNNSYDYKVSVIGDVSGDGRILINDLVKINRHIIGLGEISSLEYLYAADASGDGRVLVNDIVKVNRYIIGLGEL